MWRILKAGRIKTSEHSRGVKERATVLHKGCVQSYHDYKNSGEVLFNERTRTLEKSATHALGTDSETHVEAVSGMVGRRRAQPEKIAQGPQHFSKPGCSQVPAI